MKKLISAVFVFLVMIIASISIEAAGTAPSGITVALPGRGLFVGTLSARDFPLRAGMSGQELSREIKNIVLIAKSGGYDSIFFEARPSGDSFYSSKSFPRSAYWLGRQDKLTLQDPLKILMKEAQDKEIKVYAVINPYYLGSSQLDFSNKSPAVKYKQDSFTSGSGVYLKPESDTARNLNVTDAERLFDKYGVSGIILTGIDRQELTSRASYAESLNSLIAGICASATEYGGSVGVITARAHDALEISADSPRLFVMPKLTGAPDADFYDDISTWVNIFGKDKVMPLLMPSTTLNYADGFSSLSENELVNSVFLARSAGVTRYCIDGLRSAALNSSIPLIPSAMIDIYSLLSDSGVKLGYGRYLSITHPDGAITTSGSSYFIRGLSNPDEALYLDGKELERDTNSGIFGVLVRLKEGENRFTFKQGDMTENVRIIRDSTPAESRTTVLTNISPAYFTLSELGSPVILTCTGPYGAEVTVTVGGVTQKMLPRREAANGSSVIYEAALALPYTLYSAGVTKSAGAATYTLSYNGVTTEYTSAGEIYCVTGDAPAAVRVISENTSVYINPYIDGVFSGQLKPGTEDYIISESENYIALKSGGYIRKECCRILEGTPDIEREAGSITLLSGERDDMMVIGGASGIPFLIEENKNGIAVTLYNLNGFPDEVENFSDLFSDCVVEENGGEVKLWLPYKDNERPWGADVYYKDGGAVLAIRSKPDLKGTPGKPLDGLSVMLDPGHGGSDPGAIGVAGSQGPDERDINIAVSLITKARLEALGANVYLTNYGDSDVTLVQRMELAQDIRPDFFISIHHNSIAETSDGSGANGTEAYYHFTNGGQLANILTENVAIAEKTYRRGAYQSYYVVTKMSGFPSVLLELGFVSSPREYEKLTDPYNIFKVSGAITEAIYSLSKKS